MVARWRPLLPGEPIGVLALSGPIDQQRLAAGLELLATFGHPVLVAPNTNARSAYLAGDDAQRLAGLEWLLDRGARTLIAARGGYGITRLLTHLPWSRLVAEQVSVVGYSDLTALLNPLVHRGGVVQVHGPMVAADLLPSRNHRRLQRLLQGELVGQRLFRLTPRSVVRGGQATGVAMGGTLTMLTSLIGTPEEPDLAGSVLFLEEVNEPMYRLDRLLTHMVASGRLSRVRAIVGGSLRGCSPARERDRTWRLLLAEAAPAEAVVVAGLPFGHGARNMAFPVGATVRIDTGAGAITWRSGQGLE